MKGFVSYTLAATLVAGAAANGHNHQHLHAKKHSGSKVEKREPDVVVAAVVAGPTETVYQLAGKLLDAAKAKEGLEEGHFVIVGESVPTYSPPPPPPKPTTSSEPELGAQFIEQKTSSAPPPPPTTTAAPSSSAPPPPPKPSTVPAPSTGNGVNSKFPSGTIKCSEFPSSYGAMALDWLDFGGWSGLQFVPTYSKDHVSISDIITGIAGETCSSNCMCSYACPVGYQKTQWPSAQGSTKQSIGGLYCNSDGYLELTNPAKPFLCEKCEGGVVIQNDLNEDVATCRTDYPGTESMVIPVFAQPGDTLEVCNPRQDYFIWDNQPTSAQYYINKKGYGLDNACVWNSRIEPSGAGNWSPAILGVGKADDGTTFISIFQNRPTSTAILDFNIEITGDVTSECWYKDGVWSGGPGSDGCTTGLTEGGRATVRYY